MKPGHVISLISVDYFDASRYTMRKLVMPLTVKLAGHVPGRAAFHILSRF